MVVNGKVSVASKCVSGNIGDNGTVIGNVEKAENIYVREIEFSNRYEFPSIGKNNIVYVAKDEHKQYIFNPLTNNYEVIGSDYNEIEIIQGIL